MGTPGQEDTNPNYVLPITDKHQMQFTGGVVSQGGVETEWINKGGTTT